MISDRPKKTLFHRIAKLKKIIQSIIAFLVAAAVMLPASSAYAWDQHTHEWINYEATKVFMEKFNTSDFEKYEMGPIDSKSFQDKYRGIAVTSYSKTIPNYTIEEMSLNARQWIVKGGDWADEPHLYASVRHFFDPLARWGVHYLTDHYEFHSWYDDPKTDARTWGLDHPDNPFSFFDALSYYKASLEVPEEETFQGPSIKGDHFKLNIDITPKDAQDQRQIYLAFAYRSLGEAMHLLGDMTQPEHVRNDSHPIDSPIEKALLAHYVREAANYSSVDERMAKFLASAGGELLNPKELFRRVAFFTNLYFYSPDTIYDAESFVIPQNISYPDFIKKNKLPYDSPQFKDLIQEEVMLRGTIINRKTKRLYGLFAGKKTPLAQERLSFYWFDPDMEYKEMIARYYSLGPYHIPSAFAREQAMALMPVAIHACADLMHHFYPTMELKADYVDHGLQGEQVEGIDDYQRQVIEIDAEMLHHSNKDIAWSGYGLKIQYSGPAELIFTEAGQNTKTRKIHFLNGKIDKIENHKQEMVKEPLKVFVAESHKLIDEEAFYEIDHKERIHIEIKAGNRIFKSAEFQLEKEEEEFTVSIQPPRILIFELLEGATEAEHDFIAIASPEGVYRFDWDFGDGNNYSETKESQSSVKHVYKNLKDGDKFYPSVSIYDKNGKVLDKDAITISITAPEELPKDEETLVTTTTAMQDQTTSAKELNIVHGGTVEGEYSGPSLTYSVSGIVTLGTLQTENVRIKMYHGYSKGGVFIPGNTIQISGTIYNNSENVDEIPERSDVIAGIGIVYRSSEYPNGKSLLDSVDSESFRIRPTESHSYSFSVFVPADAYQVNITVGAVATWSSAIFAKFSAVLKPME